MALASRECFFVSPCRLHSDCVWSWFSHIGLLSWSAGRFANKVMKRGDFVAAHIDVPRDRIWG